MPIIERCGKFGVNVYDPARREKVWVGTYATRDEAEHAEFIASRVRVRTSWTLRAKGESRCRNCRTKAVVLHHIVPRAALPGRPEIHNPHYNGLPLCESCHRGWHSQSVRIGREKLQIEEIAFIAGAMGFDWLDASYPGGGLIDVNEELLTEVVALRTEVQRLRTLEVWTARGRGAIHEVAELEADTAA